jgi:PAS domain S-box-containing protein
MTHPLPHNPATPPLPANESERLAALHRYKILDTPPEAAFDRLTTLAARLFAVPTVLISLVDASRAWFKSCLGFDAREVPREATLCSFAVLTDEPLIVPDARLDDRFACNPFVQSEPGVRFYAGAPLFSRDGFNLGTLCLLDGQPRAGFSAEQQATLVDLAAMVVDELELRLAAHKIAQVDTALIEVTQGVAAVTGEAYFDALVQHFAKVLDVDYVYIGLVEGDAPIKRLRTIATCAHGQSVANLEYPLQGTPCWEVIEQHKICCYPRNVQAKFPSAPLLKPLSIESYVAIPFFDSNGTPLGLLGVMDGKPLEHVQLAESLLTLFALRIATELERQQTEAALQESEERSQNILESITDGFFALDQAWRFTYVNPQAERLLNRTPSELLDKVIWEVYPGTVGTEFERAYRQTASERVTSSFISFYPDHNCWYEVYAYPAADGITVYFRDVTDRKQAEADLRQSEERYRTLFESIDEGFCVVEVLLDAYGTPSDYRILEVNPIFEQQTGIQQAIGKTARQLNLEAHWIEIYGRVAVTGEAIRFENGSETLKRWFDVYACRTGEPKARKVAIVFRDISDRKRREANLAFLANIAEDLSHLSSSDEIMQTVGTKIGAHLNLSHCLFAEIDAAQDRAVVEYAWNPSEATDLIGVYQLSEFVTEEFQQAARAGETIVICDAQTDARTDANRYAAFNIHAFVTVPFHRNNEWKYLLTVNHAVPRDWREDEIELVRELANRVFPRLERARAEAIVAADLQDTNLLRELGARLVTEGDIQTLYQEIMAAAIALTQADAGTVQILDAATQELVLLTTQGFERTLTAHFERMSESANTPCGIALKTGTRSFVDFDVPESENPDGARRLLLEAGYRSGQSTPLITRAGKIIGMVSTHWRKHYRSSERELRFLDLLVRQAADLIEQRQTADEREQLLVREQAARAEADRANRIKDEFLAVLSHELRSPLNPILGWTRLLQNGKLDAARQTEALNTIERNAKLQAQLIEDLLDLSRIMQGKLSLTAVPVNLASVIAAALETVHLAAAAKHIQMTLDLAPNIAPVSGDATRLQQVIWNLLTNAVKFTPNGGQVTVELRQLEQAAQMRVIDTGKGIQPQFLPHVFEYFRQEDGSTTRNFGGLGLGLAIVRQIVEMHGGTVWAESEGENRGASFTVQLPLSTQARPREPEPPRASVTLEAPLSNLQILLVDDETDTREFQALVLEQSGATVTAVASGFEALQVLDQFMPDLLISDIGMAAMDGYMLIQQIRSREALQSNSHPPAQVRTMPAFSKAVLPAIALTAYAGAFEQRKAIESGFQAHLTKPVEPEALVKAIVGLLRNLSSDNEHGLFRDSGDPWS